MRKPFIFFFSLLTTLLSPAPLVSQTLKKVATVEVPGTPGKRFDYLTIDYDDHYLFVAHLGAGLLHVIDLQNLKVVKTVPDVPGIEGVEYAPDLKKLYTSNYYENKIGVVDVKELKLVKKLPTENKPDGSTYAQPFHKVYVSDERGKAEAVVDVAQDKIVRTLKFDSETGMPQYDPVAKKVYVNLQSKNLLAVIDPSDDRVISRYPVGKCRANHGMALDPDHHRAFLSCEGNTLMTVFDLDHHQPIAYLPLARDPDVIKFDPGLNRIYVACYSGFISVFQQDDPNHYRKLEDFPVQEKVHSLAVDLQSHRLFAPEEWADRHPASRVVVYEPVVGK